MLSKVRVKVNGKVNLSLNIVGEREGYHLIDSVVTSVSVSDYVTVRDRLDDKVNLFFNADFTPKDNTVLKAINALRRRFGNFGVDVVVDKHLPLSGGMGGSSADAAAVIAALNALFDFDKRGLDLREVCAEVGSDVYYMLGGGYARLSGVGDEVTPFEGAEGLGLVYFTAGETVTRDVYARYDELGGDGEVDNDLLIKTLPGVRKNEFCPSDLKLGNMLLRAACSLNGEIEKCLSAFKEVGAANMSGSGSTVYVICSDCEKAAAKLREKGYNVKTAFIVPRGIEFV